MSNSLVEQYRSLKPNDPRTDDELTQVFGKANEEDGRYNGFPDFVEDYSNLKNNSIPEAVPYELPPSVKGEFGKALKEGGSSLKQAATGFGALLASYGGWDSMRDSLLDSYKKQSEAGADNAPAIPNLEDIKSPHDFALYLAAKAGGLIPQLGEAVATSAAGALVGSAVAPGPGTAAGAGEGFLEGFLGRKAAASLLELPVKKLAEKLGVDEAAAAVTKSELEKVVAKNAAEAVLDKGAVSLLKKEATSYAIKHGELGANLLNFYGLGAGGTYGQLATTPGIDEGDAKTASVIAGAGSAAGALLPHYITSRLFPGVADKVAGEYIEQLAKDAAKVVPLTAGGMGLMEVASIAAEKYADPKKRNEGWTDDDTSRLWNSIAVGGTLGGVTSLGTAFKGPSKSITPKLDPAVENHVKDVADSRRAEIEALKGRIEAGNQTLADDALLRSLTPQERDYYAVAKSVPLQEQTRAEANPAAPAAPPAGDGAGSSDNVTVKVRTADGPKDWTTTKGDAVDQLTKRNAAFEALRNCLDMA